MHYSRMLMWTAAMTIVSALGILPAAGAQRPAKVQTMPGAKGKGAAGHAGANTRAANNAKGQPKTQTDRVQGNTGTGDRRRDNRAAQTIADRIVANPQQRTRVEAMLPAGMTLEQASTGFRNQGQFIAALNAARTHNIPFAALQTEMTGEQALSLGQALEKLEPSTSTP